MKDGKSSIRGSSAEILRKLKSIGVEAEAIEAEVVTEDTVPGEGESLPHPFPMETSAAEPR